MTVKLISDNQSIDFEEKPLASASLAQVHKAHLRGAPEGEYVAVKV
jgi:predicted unusual protein kinase regulating ubiquinone biosynthesis (AarF/ABC1/UbiB family)